MTVPQSSTASPGEQALQLLLAACSGRPVVQIVLDPESDAVTISGAGVDESAIPEFLWRLAGALTGRATRTDS